MGALIRTQSGSNGDVLSYYSDEAPVRYSIYEIKNQLSNFQLNPHYRIYWLNPDETVKEIMPESDIIVGGSYDENYQNGQRKSLSINLYNETGKYTPSINGLWGQNKFLYELGIELNNGDIVWFRKGIFISENASPTHNSNGKTLSLSLSDKFSVLESKKAAIKDTLVIDSGSDIEGVINGLLDLDVGDGYKLDPKPIIMHSRLKGAKTAKEITESAGTTIGSIIIELAEMISAEVFYNNDGFLTFVPFQEVTADADKQIICQLYEENGDFSNDDLQFNFGNITNRVVVIGTNVDGTNCRAEAVNDDPSSPLCYQRIGYYTASPIEDSDISSDILAQERADYELRKALIMSETTNMASYINPILDVNNVIGITDSFYNFQQEKFLIQSVSYSLDYSPSINLTISNLNNFGFLSRRGV